MLDKVQKTEQLRKIKDEVLNLSNSPLFKYRSENNYLPVIGEGSHDARIMFVGEAPGKNEAISERPFCGSAGKLLDELLSGINIDRKSVYITNIVKDRPQKNRDPLPEEIEIYGPFLDRQINIIQPEIIVTLGRFSMRYILDKVGLEEKLGTIGDFHGKIFEGTVSYGRVLVLPLYHPAATIYNRKLIDVLKEDFKLLKKYGKGN